MLIQQFNESLHFDDAGNILFSTPVQVTVQGADVWIGIVWKNGKVDEDYTQRAIKEQAGQFFESLGENALEFLAGLVSVVSGVLLDTASLAGGAAGLALGLPTGGTLAIPAEAVAVAGFAAGTTMVVGGAAAMGDALSQMAAANASLNVSFAKDYNSRIENAPTSKTISGKGGKYIEARVGSKKVKLRVDWEPNSGTNGEGVFQVQSGSGKVGYDVDAHLNINEITGKNYIQNFVNKHPQLKNLAKSVKEEIVNRIWKTYQRNY